MAMPWQQHLSGILAQNPCCGYRFRYGFDGQLRVQCVRAGFDLIVPGYSPVFIEAYSLEELAIAPVFELPLIGEV